MSMRKWSRRFSRCEIKPSHPIDATYLATNMREQDLIEVGAQVPQGTTATEIGLLALSSSPRFCYTAWADGEPVTIFGLHPMTFAQNVWNGWLFGTDDTPRVVHYIIAYVVDYIIPVLEAERVTRIEVRTIEDNYGTMRWLEKLGAGYDGLLPRYGRHGENFCLWAWTDENWRRDKKDIIAKYAKISGVNGVALVDRPVL